MFGRDSDISVRLESLENGFKLTVGKLNKFEDNSNILKRIYVLMSVFTKRPFLISISVRSLSGGTVILRRS